MHLIEVGFGTRQDDGEGQVKSKGRERDDGQTKVTSSAFSRRFHILGVIHLIYVTRDAHRFFLTAFPAGYMKGITPTLDNYLIVLSFVLDFILRYAFKYQLLRIKLPFQVQTFFVFQRIKSNIYQ